MGAQAAGYWQQKEDSAAEEERRIDALRKEYGAGETVATKFLQGALDGLLAPGALVGAGAESAGELFRNKWLRDAGRGLGEASSGREALKAIRGLTTAASEGAYAGAEASDIEGERIEATQEARPLLSTISRMAGLSATAIGMGAASAGESGTIATIAANAGEGAAGGAQAAYEHSAPLRDVLSSTAVGGILGGAIAGAGEGVQHLIKKSPDLARVFADKVQDWADNRIIKAAIDRDPKGWKLIAEMAPERKARIAERLRGVDMFGKGDQGILEALTVKSGEADHAVNALAKQLDQTPGVVANTSKMEADIATQIAELRSPGSASLNRIARKIESEVQPFRQKLAIPGTDSLGNEMTMGYRNATFQELLDYKRGLGSAIDWTAKDPLTLQMKRMWRTVADGLNDAADSAGPGIKSMWREANEASSDLRLVSDALKRQIPIHARNRMISATDYLSGISAGIATAVVTGNPLGMLAAAGGALANKAVRTMGSEFFGNLANKFARTVRHISTAAAGGPESAEVLSAIARTKAFMADTAESAGANPTLRQAASESAKQVAAEQLAKKAGPFNPAAWHEKPLNPLQKVLYRTQVLDAASEDIAKVARATAELHPEIPAALDPRRLQKLTRDANGTEAIGSLQNMTAESAAAVPSTPTGDAAGVMLRKLGMALETADPAQAMEKAHEAAGWFRQAGEYAQDDLSKEFAVRTEQALRSELSQPHWGQAGIEYGKMAAPPHAALEHLANPKVVREALSAGEGEVKHAATQAHDALLDAHNARFKLTGEKQPDDIAQKVKGMGHLLDVAEEAVTLDGRPMARLFDAANVSGVYEGTESHLESVNEHTVEKHVGPALDELAGAMKNQRRAGQVAGAMIAPRELDRETYDERVKNLTRSIANPDTVTQHTMYASVAPDVGQLLSNLMGDLPKPTPSVRGKAFETLSQDDLRLANAMWEATTEPMSVFKDLAAGSLDPDKAAYAWKQYPGLQKAAQAGVVDVLMALPEDERSKVPDTVLTQVDSALGFGGKLQDANDPGFAARMSKLYQPAPPKPQPGGMLKTPMAEPTYTERLSGQE
jgi:hypothetical protein